MTPEEFQYLTTRTVTVSTDAITQQDMAPSLQRISVLPDGNRCWKPGAGPHGNRSTCSGAFQDRLWRPSWCFWFVIADEPFTHHSDIDLAVWG